MLKCKIWNENYKYLNNNKQYFVPGRPKISYENPCSVGVPATDERGAVLTCREGGECGEGHTCTRGGRHGPAVCCPQPDTDTDNTTEPEILEVRRIKENRLFKLQDPSISSIRTFEFR